MEAVIEAVGHEAVQATHASTLEVTTDDYLTAAGDCIVAVSADRAPISFDSAFVAACRDRTATISATLSVAGHTQTISGRGDPALTFASERSAVIRTSEYVDDRTILVEADTAAADLDRSLVNRLQAGERATLVISVRP